MSNILGISSGGIAAYQRALSTVSNNIANVNTEGYSRQEVSLKDSAPKKEASMYLGTGVLLDSIKRQFDSVRIRFPSMKFRKESQIYFLNNQKIWIKQ